MDDDILYLRATKEVESENMSPALWSKAMALTEGDKSKAKYKYVKLRVKQLSNKKHDIKDDLEENDLLDKSTNKSNDINVNNTGRKSKSKYILMSALAFLLAAFIASMIGFFIASAQGHAYHPGESILIFLILFYFLQKKFTNNVEHQEEYNTNHGFKDEDYNNTDNMEIIKNKNIVKSIKKAWIVEGPKYFIKLYKNNIMNLGFEVRFLDSKLYRNGKKYYIELEPERLAMKIIDSDNKKIINVIYLDRNILEPTIKKYNWNEEQ